MATLYTIDASVFVSAYNVSEDGHEDSLQFIELLRERDEPIIEPSLLLPEVAAAISRVYGDAEMALEFADSLRELPHLTLIPLNSTLAWQSAKIAANYRLRGSDAVYAAVARSYGAALVTLDREQRRRVSTVLPALSPGAAAAAMIPGTDEEG